MAVDEKEGLLPWSTALEKKLRYYKIKKWWRMRSLLDKITYDPTDTTTYSMGQNDPYYMYGQQYVSRLDSSTCLG
jgi:hypothetical protein